MDTGCLFSAEFDGVADEVLEELADLGRVRDDFREWIVGHQGPLRMERPGEILQRDLQNGGRVDHLEWPGVGTDAGIFQEIHDKPLHAFHALQGEADVTVRLGIKVSLASPLQEGQETSDGDQWLLQVMGRNGGKPLQIEVAPLQLRREGRQFLLRRPK